MRRLFLITLMMTSLFGYSQSRYSLLYHARDYILEEGDLQDKLEPTKSEAYLSRVYRIVQFYQIPDNEERAQIIESGMNLLYYMPKNAYYVSVPRDYQLRPSIASGIRAISPVLPEMKMSVDLVNNNIPDSAWVGDNYRMELFYYSDFSPKDVMSFLSVLEESQEISDLSWNENGMVRLTTHPRKVDNLAKLPFVSYLQPYLGLPEIDNFKAVTSHRVTAVSNGVDGYDLDGSGVVLGVGDDGRIGPHIDFQNRFIDLATNTSSSNDHGDHVVGTIFGAGNRNPEGRGMAPGAEIVMYEWWQNISNIQSHYNTYNVRITSNSLRAGCNTYNSQASLSDQRIRQLHYLNSLHSAGNNNGQPCSNPYGAGTTYGNITGGYKQGKNVIAVGSLTTTDAISSFSSRGPASDGRVKPEVVGLGSSVYSTLPNNSYGYKSGTSMSTPGAAGTLALLVEHYKNENSGAEPFGGLVKAIFMNTAEDLGNSGPDYTFGYGRINALRSIETISNGYYMMDSISQNSLNTHTINVPAGIKQVRFMLYWTDWEGFPASARALVHEIDLEVTHDTSSYLPWVLDPTPNVTNLTKTAVRAVDSLNNVEQVTILNPDSGSYTLNISGHTIPFGPQQYFITYYFDEEALRITSPYGNEKVDPTENLEIRWDAVGGSGNYKLEYSADNGLSWNTIANTVPQSTKRFNWNIPNSVVTNEALVRITRGSDTSISRPFTIIRPPGGIQVVFACPDSIGIQWNPVSGATGYYVHRMGSKYMEVVAYSDTTFAILDKMNQSIEYWYSVSAIGPDSVTGGIRSNAVKKNPGLSNCVISSDAQLTLMSPQSMTLKSCLDLSSVPVDIEIENLTNAVYDSVEVYYQHNNGTVIKEVIQTPLSPSASMTHTFNDSISFNVGMESLLVWMVAHGDLNAYNDTDRAHIDVIQGSSDSILFYQNFDSFSTCNKNLRCELENCILIDGWHNEINGVVDDVDFRSVSGSTPSNGTGPSGDHTSGNGKYLYVEASNCHNHRATLISNCIDLGSVANPELTFWYHMNGSSMGDLHLDVIVDGKLHEDITPYLSGTQGNFWKARVVDLSQFSNKIITLRFRAVTGNNNWSDIAIDDISIYDASVQVPAASFTSSSAPDICVGDPVVFTSTSTGTIHAYDWNFGSGATPSTASTAGPHTVTYSFLSTEKVQLTVANQGGLSKADSNFNVIAEPVSAFTYSVNNINNVDFTDISSNNPNNWSWDFGDGNQASVQDPSHTYANPGTYTVELVATNDCGSDTIYKDVIISGIGIEEQSLARKLTLAPNPAKDQINLTWKGSHRSTISFEIYNALGQRIHSANWNTVERVYSLDIDSWQSGIYWLDVYDEDEHYVIKWIKE